MGTAGTIGRPESERPRHVQDFDLPLGFHDLVERGTTEDGATWTTARTMNVVGSILCVMLVGVALTVARFHREFDIAGWPAVFASILGGVIWVPGMAVAIGGMLHRGKLVIDRRRRELRFYRGLGQRLWHVLTFDEIRGLYQRCHTVGGSGFDDTPVTYDILAARLHDGRVASLAVNSPRALRNAIATALKR